MEVRVVCPTCGTRQSESANYCSNCGSMLRPGAPPALHSEQAQALRYRTLVDQLGVATYLAALDEPNTLLYVSPAVAVLGIAPAEWLAAPTRWIERIHPEDRAHVVAERRRAQTGEQRFAAEYRLLAREDETVWCRDEAVLVVVPR